MIEKTRLNSKKNQVFRIIKEGNSYIEKTFTDNFRMKKEVEILKILKHNECKVPEIIEIYEQTLILEDLGMITLLDWYESIEKDGSTNYIEVIEQLGQWLSEFYFNINKVYNDTILFDVNFRNFVIKNDVIYGIDFEECQIGTRETDIGKLAAYSMTYDPAMTQWKIDFSEQVIEILSQKLNLDIELVIQERNKELINIRNRRNL